MPKLRISLIVLLVSVQLQSISEACPFCSAISQTFTEEMKMMDVAVIAKRKPRGRTRSVESSPQYEVPEAVFEITEVLKGDQHFKVGDTFTTMYLGTTAKDDSLLVMATDAPKFVWSSPLCLTDRAKNYLRKLRDLPSGPERLDFFQDYLGDEDEILAKDAYDEFAVAPYANLISLKAKMNRQRLVEFIKDPYVASRHRKLYFTMLGVCGTKEDAKLLEDLMSSEDPRSRAGLDALLACYVNLTGEEGLDKVDELFLKNPNAEYADTYSAIMAIRFHDSETNVVRRERLAESLKHMLKRPELADLVIADLAKWEDWSVISILCELFVSADEDSSYVRVPVIKYLQACPLPIAKDKIEELKLVDPEAVHSALTYADSIASNLESTAPTQPAPLNPGFLETTNATPKKVPVAMPVSSLQRAKTLPDFNHRNAVPSSNNNAGSTDAKAMLNLPLVAGTTVCLGLVILFWTSRRSTKTASRN